MRIAIITDAWYPQINGVVRTLAATRIELERQGHIVEIISPDLYRSLPCPTYPEIRLAMARARSVGERITQFNPDAVHLSTEGPLCAAARRWCLRNTLPFTTAFHTQFPDYFAARTGMPAEWVWKYLRWFHGASQAVLVSTSSVRQMLTAHGIVHHCAWSRGVDLRLFNPSALPPDSYGQFERPIQLYVGRVAVEKNIEAFLRSDHPGTKVVVGDGPARSGLAARYGDVHFVGSLSGAALAGAYAGADVLVFPSRTDTFGLVMIEALACGTPVAAYPVSGPIDIVTRASGALDDDLARAVGAALVCDRDVCARYGATFTWTASAAQFVAALVPLQQQAAAA